jgi:hypothetical protein
MILFFIEGKTTILIANSYAEKKEWIAAFIAAGVRVERFRVDSIDDIPVPKPASP